MKKQILLPFFSGRKKCFCGFVCFFVRLSFVCVIYMRRFVQISWIWIGSLGNILLLLTLIVELLVVNGGLLVLLVLGHQIVHVGLGLSELHLVHALTSVPMQESLAPEHGGELLGDALEQLLDGSGVANEGGGHLKATGWDVTNSGLHIVGDPLNKVGAVLVLDVEHLLVDLLHGHASSEDSSHCEISAVAGITGSHHVLGIEHLLGELGHTESSVLLAAPGGERSKTGDEEVEAGEGHHVHGQLPEVSVQLTGEAEAGGDARHGQGDQVVEVTIGGGAQLQRAEADVVESLIVNAERLVGVLNQLVDGEGGIVWLDNGVGHLGRGHNRVCVHDPGK